MYTPVIVGVRIPMLFQWLMGDRLYLRCPGVSELVPTRRLSRHLQTKQSDANQRTAQIVDHGSVIVLVNFYFYEGEMFL